MDRRAFLRTSTLASLALSTTGCGAQEALLGTRSSVRVAVSWGGTELAAFRRILAGLRDIPARSDYVVDVVPYGDSIDVALAARGTPRPDVVMLPNTSQVHEFRDELEPLDDIWLAGSGAYNPQWRSVLSDDGSDSGPVRGIPFKAANKSVVWYRKDLVRAPTSWTGWLAEIDRLRMTGSVAPLALGAADGWVLSDFLENVFLASAPAFYRKFVSAGEQDRDWASTEVRQALAALGEIWGRRGIFSGGVARSLMLQYPDAVYEVFGYGHAAMVVAPDFAESVIHEIYPDPQRRSERVGVFRFPAIPPNTVPALVGTGDVIVLLKPARDAARDLVRRLADPKAPLPWIAGTGGFISANRITDARAYSGEMRQLEATLDSEGFSFDLSDQLDAVVGRGLLRALTDYLIDIGDERTARLDDAIERVIARLTCLHSQERLEETGLDARARGELGGRRNDSCPATS